jgi:hypothetical protein
MVGKVAWQFNMPANVNFEVNANLPPMSLEIVALNGTSITLNQTAIGNLPAVRGVGAFRNVLGNVKDLGNYTGPSLNTLCNLVGGMNNNTVLRITATDNYTQTLSYNMVNGAFTTYNVTNGNPIQHNQSLTPILAYYFNDANLTTDQGGPLRLAIVGPEGLATYSSYWVKWVVKLEIRHIDDVAVTPVVHGCSFCPQYSCYAFAPAVGRGFSDIINVTVSNRGSYTETFDITFYANATAIATQTVTLTNGSSTIPTFKWNTTGLAMGNYIISANVTLAPGEMNSWTSPFTYGTVQITKVGDLGSASASPPFYQFGVFDGKVNSADTTMFILCLRGEAPAQYTYLADLGGASASPPFYQFFKCDGKVNSADTTMYILCLRGEDP